MIIQRFVSINRFLSSFEKMDGQWYYKIRFNSPALYDDPWEGLGNGFVKVLKATEPTAGYFNRVLQDGGVFEKGSLHQNIKAIYQLQGNQDQLLLDELENAIEYSNQHLCSCWFIGDVKNEVRESWAMWNQYASMNGVLLAFDLYEVKRSIQHPIEAKKVEYTDFINAKFKKCIHQEISSLFYKDLAYKHEQEYRIIITKPHNSSSFLDLLIPLPKVVVAHPSMSTAAIDHLNESLYTYGLKMKSSILHTGVSRKEILDFLKGH